MSTDVERIKRDSRGLRGGIFDGLEDRASGALAEDDAQLTKFHGIYQQDDRDLRADRLARRLEPAYSFMIRVRVPGGELSADQWLALSAIARRFADDSVRLTTRQAVQFHGVIKGDLRATIQSIDAALLDTIAACGDVNRNVMVSALPERSQVHAEVLAIANRISAHLTPATRAWREIWIDGERVTETAQAEPIYGATYLPRKFKIAFVVPPDNDCDVLAQDLGFIAVVEDGGLTGFNVTVGGGMGMSHGVPETYPRLADPIGFCAPDQVLAVAEQVVTIQRDFGNRENRKRARLKYTIDDRGLDWFRAELEDRLGFGLAGARPYRFQRHGDRLGWHEDADGRGYLTLHVASGRLRDPALAALDELARRGGMGFRITPNQNLIVTGIDANDRQAVNACLGEAGVLGPRGPSPMTGQALACVGLPTCPLSMAESERYLPDFTAALDDILRRHELADLPLGVRITGCPNGCARPYVAEVALVGKAPGRYNLHLGGDGRGERLNVRVAENLPEADILQRLEALIADYARHRDPEECFGDYLWRAGMLREASS